MEVAILWIISISDETKHRDTLSSEKDCGALVASIAPDLIYPFPISVHLLTQSNLCYTLGL